MVTSITTTEKCSGEPGCYRCFVASPKVRVVNIRPRFAFAHIELPPSPQPVRPRQVLRPLEPWPVPGPPVVPLEVPPAADARSSPVLLLPPEPLGLVRLLPRLHLRPPLALALLKAQLHRLGVRDLALLDQTITTSQLEICFGIDHFPTDAPPEVSGPA